MKIAKKTALVLGASRGIGKAIALALADAGANVVMPYFDWPEDVAAMKEELAKLHNRGNRSLAVKTDLRDPEQVTGLVRQIEETFGSLHIVINNIERGGMPIVHGPYVPEQVDLEIDTTLKAKWWVYTSALPLMKKSASGIIINISSIAAIIGRNGPAGLIFNDIYSSVNRAIASFTESWAREAAPKVRVNELMLGFFETRHAEKTRGWEMLDDQQRSGLINHCLLRRTGKIDEIVKTVFFLIEDATYMTGSVLRLDGGYVLGGHAPQRIPDGVETINSKAIAEAD